ncbi:MAG: hypothetical protein P9L92_02560 [Candidatus Electryonea clarkiae]|nr:hypothetical protein [Candidatus Electryonea clarkiae]MDP8288711.1 hypothetical protein [Candidatus Electryonea clarkiae]
MRTILIIISCLIPIVTTASPRSESELSPTVADARAFAMGKCSIFGCQNSASMFYNPANLSFLTKGTISTVGRIRFAKMEDELWDDTSYYKSRSRDLFPLYKLLQFSMAAPLKKKSERHSFAMGIGYNTYYDMAFNEEDNRETNSQKTVSNTKATGGLTVLTSSISWDYMDRFKLGISINKSIFAKMRLDIKTEELQLNNNDNSNSSIIMDADLDGAFVLMGSAFRLSEQLLVGITFRSDFEMKISDVSASYESYRNGVAIDDTTVEGDDANSSIPGNYGIGIQYISNGGVLLIGEYQNRPWSEYKFDGEDSEKEDGYILRLGIEMMIKSHPLRFGFFRDALEYTYGDDNKPLYANGITTGTALKFKKSIIDIYGSIDWIKWSRDYRNSDGVLTMYDAIVMEFIFGFGLTF